MSDDDFKNTVLDALSRHGALLTAVAGDVGELKTDVAELHSDLRASTTLVLEKLDDHEQRITALERRQ